MTCAFTNMFDEVAAFQFPIIRFLIFPYFITSVMWQRSASNGKSTRRVSGASIGGPSSSSSKRGSEKRRMSTTMVKFPVFI